MASPCKKEKFFKPKKSVKDEIWSWCCAIASELKSMLIWFTFFAVILGIAIFFCREMFLLLLAEIKG